MSSRSFKLTLWRLRAACGLAGLAVGVISFWLDAGPIASFVNGMGAAVIAYLVVIRAAIDAVRSKFRL